jgi:hypothetical protein
VPVRDRELYVRALDALARSGFVWVIATMRSDFFTQFDELPSLHELVPADAAYHLSLPVAAEIAQMVRQPARVTYRGSACYCLV